MEKYFFRAHLNACFSDRSYFLKRPIEATAKNEINIELYERYKSKSSYCSFKIGSNQETLIAGIVRALLERGLLSISPRAVTCNRRQSSQDPHYC